MSKSFATALVAFTQASSSAHAFPHAPTPESLRQRVAQAAKDVADAASEVIEEIERVVEYDNVQIERGVEYDVGEMVKALVGNEQFVVVLADAIRATVNVADLVASPAIQAEISKAVDAKVEAALKKAQKKTDERLDAIETSAKGVVERVTDLEEFAEKVDGDLGPRLTKLEASAAADGDA